MLTAMVSEPANCRLKFVASSAAQWWEARGIAAGQPADNARVVALNFNRGTDKQLHTFPKQLQTFQMRQLSQMNNYIAIDFISQNIWPVITDQYRLVHKNSMQIMSCRFGIHETITYKLNMVVCYCFVSNNNHIFTTH